MGEAISSLSVIVNSYTMMSDDIGSSIFESTKRFAGFIFERPFRTVLFTVIGP